MKEDDYHFIVQSCVDPRVEDIARNINTPYIAQFSAQPLTLSNELEEKIALAWNEELQGAKKAGKPVPHNNDFVHCQGYEVQNGLGDKANIGFKLGLTDWIHYSMIRKVDPKTRIWTIGTAALTYFNDKESSERVFVFATRDHNKVKDVGGKMESPPGGYLDASLLGADLATNCGVHTGVIFNENVLKEFEEEMGLDCDQVRVVQPIELIKFTHVNDFSLDFLLGIDATEEELREGFKKSTKYGGEHAGQFFVPEHELATFVKEHQKVLTPRTKATLRNYFLLTS